MAVAGRRIRRCLLASHFFIVCWNRSTLPQVWGWNGREVIGVTPAARRLISNSTSTPRSLPEKHSPLSLSCPLGTPQWAVASVKVSQAASVVTVGHTRQRSATRLQSSRNDRICTPPVATTQAV